MGQKEVCGVPIKMVPLDNRMEHPINTKGAWKQLPPSKNCRFGVSISILGNEIFAIGGGWPFPKEKDDRVQIFNSKNWRYGNSLSENECFSPFIAIIPQHTAGLLCENEE